MDKVTPALVAIVGSVIGLAMLAVIVSKNAQTPAVITGAGNALSGIIAAAVAPVSNNAQSSAFGAANPFGLLN